MGREVILALLLASPAGAALPRVLGGAKLGTSERTLKTVKPDGMTHIGIGVSMIDTELDDLSTKVAEVKSARSYWGEARQLLFVDGALIAIWAKGKDGVADRLAEKIGSPDRRGEGADAGTGGAVKFWVWKDDATFLAVLEGADGGRSVVLFDRAGVKAAMAKYESGELKAP